MAGGWRRAPDMGKILKLTPKMGQNAFFGIVLMGNRWGRRLFRCVRSLVGGSRFALGGSRRKPKPPRRGEGAVAEPWVGVDSSKPPRLFATVASPG